MNNSGNAKGYGLKSISNSQVDSATFYLGGREYDPSTKYGTTEDIYMWERGNITYNQNESERSKIWNGEIALIYPSDYLYAYSKEIDRNCYNYPNECYLNGNPAGLPANGWLYISNVFDGIEDYQWNWSLALYSGRDDRVFSVYSSGNIGTSSPNGFAGVRPVLYLSSSVKIIDGDGSINNPYKLGL